MGIGAAIAGGIASLATSLGATAAIAGTIGTLGSGALIGAGIGAAGSALMGGKPGIGALTGGLTGGLMGGFGGTLGSALGIGTGGADALIGAGVGGIGAAVTGGNPLTGALMGGATGYLGSMLGGGAGPGTWGGSDTALAGEQPVDSGAFDTAGSAVTDAAGAVTGGNSGWSAASDAGTAGIAAAKGGISNTALMLGALSMAGQMFNKPQQAPYGNTPGPTQVAANTGPYWNQGLNTNAPGRVAVNPYAGQPNVMTPVGYQTLGGPEQTYFTGNSLLNFGFAKGGALSRMPERDFRTGSGAGKVRGPGTETSDSIPARLSQNEYVLDAQDVRNIGHGSIRRGTRALDRARPQLARGRGALANLVAA